MMKKNVKKLKKETLLDQLIYKNTIELMEFENKYKVEIQKAIDIIENKIQIALLHKDDVLDINECQLPTFEKRGLVVQVLTTIGLLTETLEFFLKIRD
jgi:hypothetical protein